MSLSHYTICHWNYPLISIWFYLSISIDISLILLFFYYCTGSTSICFFCKKNWEIAAHLLECDSDVLPVMKHKLFFCSKLVFTSMFFLMNVYRGKRLEMCRTGLPRSAYMWYIWLSLDEAGFICWVKTQWRFEDLSWSFGLSLIICAILAEQIKKRFCFNINDQLICQCWRRKCCLFLWCGL